MIKKLLFLMMGTLFLAGCMNQTKTIEEALQKEEKWENVFHIEKLDENTAFFLMEDEEGGLQIGSAYLEKNKWKTGDTTGIFSLHDDSVGFGGGSGPLKVSDNRSVDFIVGIITDEKIDQIMAYSSDLQKETKVNIMKTPKGNRIYYKIDDKLTGNAGISYKAYSKTGELLYDK